MRVHLTISFRYLVIFCAPCSHPETLAVDIPACGPDTAQSFASDHTEPWLSLSRERLLWISTFRVEIVEGLVLALNSKPIWPTKPYSSLFKRDADSLAQASQYDIMWHHVWSRYKNNTASLCKCKATGCITISSRISSRLSSVWDCLWEEDHTPRRCESRVLHLVQVTIRPWSQLLSQCTKSIESSKKETHKRIFAEYQETRLSINIIVRFNRETTKSCRLWLPHLQDSDSIPWRNI